MSGPGSTPLPLAKDHRNKPRSSSKESSPAQYSNKDGYPENPDDLKTLPLEAIEGVEQVRDFAKQQREGQRKSGSEEVEVGALVLALKKIRMQNKELEKKVTLLENQKELLEMWVTSLSKDRAD